MTRAPKMPSFLAFNVRERKGHKAIWTQIGAVWPHADGNGFNLDIDVVPLGGRITLRTPLPRKE